VRALIVEDDFIGRKILLKYLLDYFDCDVAVNGDEARTAFQLGWIDDEPYDVIFLDIFIPGINGYEVLKHIRDYENENKTFKSKIIMVTALDDQKQVMKAYKEQCDGYIIKPINIEKLKQVCEESGVRLVRKF